METQIIDASSTFLTLAHSVHGDKRSAAAIEDLASVRKMILSYLNKHLVASRPVVLAVDSGSWRKGPFVQYKARRAEEKAKSTFPYEVFLPLMQTVFDELEEFSPVIVIKCPKTEADDIVAILTAILHPDGVTIHSTDKDLLQLQLIYENTRQFNPNEWKYVTPQDKGYTLAEHIVRGDNGDGIPNIYSEDNVFVDHIRSVVLTAPRYAAAHAMVISKDPEVWSDPDMKRRYERNRLLIDLRCIPDDIAVAVLEQYEARLAVVRPHGTFNRYLASHGIV